MPTSIPIGRSATLAALAAGAWAAGLSACAGPAAAGPGAAAGPVALAAAPERLGIDLSPPRLLAAGYLVEIRCRVVDAAKARPFLERAGEARLVDQASGAALEAAVRGARPPETAEAAGRVCPLLFDDTLRKVGPGAHVALSLPGIEVRDLAVGE